MNGTARRVAVFLTCVAIASSAAAQDTNRNQDTNTNVERGRAKTEAARRAAQAKAESAQRRTTARGRGQADISEAFSQTVRLVPGGTLDLLSGSGDVTVSGGGGQEARIEAIKRVRDTVAARARTAINEVRIDIAERGGNVEVRTIQPRGPSRVTVEYRIRVPDNTNLILRSTSGNLHVENMAGDELSANTISGRITLRDLTSRMLDLHSVMGDMLLHDIEARRAFVQSTSGNLEYAGRLLPTGRYQLQTHRGNIRFVPSGEPGFDLEAMTYSGDLRTDFVLKLLEPLAGRQGRRPMKMLRGTVGNAGALVTASTFSGNVLIVKPE
ncbi:MAG: DUF4097 family beta strand repeat-containing protein [Vicinamibacterales bacterium]